MQNRPEVYSLFSGSGGNCTLIKSEDCSVLIDAGKSGRALCDALKSVGSGIDEIDGIFITHEHSDHVSALGVLCRGRDIPVYMNRLSYESWQFEGKTDLNTVIFDGSLSERVKGFLIETVTVPHDSAYCVGYRITDSRSGCKIGVSTDIGNITPEIFSFFSECSGAVIESNHSVQMVKNGPYPQLLKERILSDGGHLSNEDSAEFIRHLCDAGTQEFILAHLSENNNTPGEALSNLRRQLGEKRAERIKVCAAEQNGIRRLGENDF